MVHSSYINGDEYCMYLSGLAGENAVSQDQLKASFSVGGDFIELMFSFSERFNAFQLSPTEVALFGAIVMICPGRLVSHYCFDEIKCTSICNDCIMYYCES